MARSALSHYVVNSSSCFSQKKFSHENVISFVGLDKKLLTGNCSCSNLASRSVVCFSGINYAEGSQDSKIARKLGLLIEVEGVVSDIHKYGHRVSFNEAYRELGLDCAEWSPIVYADLLRQAGGNEDLMVRAYFDSIGWPTTLPTNEKPIFVKNVLRLKEQALLEASRSGKIPLRPGLSEFLKEAISFSAPSPDSSTVSDSGFSSVSVSVLVSNAKCGEAVARNILSQLDPSLLSCLAIVGERQVATSQYSQVAALGDTSISQGEILASKLAEAVKAEKQRVASEVARELKVSVELDTGSSKLVKDGVALLRAGAEWSGVPATNCVLLAGSHPGLQMSAAVGMKCIVVRSSITTRAEFPLARATVEGFGPGSLTVSRLIRMLL